MKLDTTWTDDDGYIWHYFTTPQDALVSSNFGTLVVESSPAKVWRSRVALIGFTPTREIARLQEQRTNTQE